MSSRVKEAQGELTRAAHLCRACRWLHPHSRQSAWKPPALTRGVLQPLGLAAAVGDGVGFHALAGLGALLAVQVHSLFRAIGIRRAHAAAGVREPGAAHPDAVPAEHAAPQLLVRHHHRAPAVAALHRQDAARARAAACSIQAGTAAVPPVWRGGAPAQPGSPRTSVPRRPRCPQPPPRQFLLKKAGGQGGEQPVLGGHLGCGCLPARRPPSPVICPGGPSACARSRAAAPKLARANSANRAAALLLWSLIALAEQSPEMRKSARPHGNASEQAGRSARSPSGRSPAHPPESGTCGCCRPPAQRPMTSQPAPGRRTANQGPWLGLPGSAGPDTLSLWKRGQDTRGKHPLGAPREQRWANS